MCVKLVIIISIIVFVYWQKLQNASAIQVGDNKSRIIKVNKSNITHIIIQQLVRTVVARITCIRIIHVNIQYNKVSSNP